MARVLVVDDEKSIRETLGEFLLMDGHDVETAEDAEVAGALVDAQPFDVVVTDIILPRVSGVTLLQRLRERAPDTPVILMTGEPTTATAIEAVRAGAYDYLVKPVGKRDLLRTVGQAARLQAALDEKRRLEAEKHEYLEGLERAVEERTRSLRESEEHYRDLYENAPVAYFSVDVNGAVLRCNRRAGELLGYTIDQIVGRPVLELYAETAHGRPAAAELFRRFRSGEFVRDEELQMQRANGAPVWVSLSVNAVWDERGQVVESRSVVVDLSRRKWMEEKLRLQMAAIESAANGIVITARDGRIIWANAALSTLTGYTRAEVLGQTPRILKSGRHDGAFYEVLWETILAGRVWHGEITNQRKDGSMYVEDMTITPICDDAGSVTHFVAVKQDVTEPRRLQAQLVQSEKLAAMGYLLAGVAHELNNPLTVVIGQTQLLGRANDPVVVARAERIGSAASRCARIVKNFLALARQHEPERQEADINAVVSEVLELLAYQLRVDDIAVRPALATDVPTLFADPHLLQQVVVNLVMNAYHAMRRGPRPRRLTITTRRLSGSVEGVHLEVEDTGPGIAPDVEAHVFDPFFTTKPIGEGTGLGLSLCKSIVESHGGTLTVDGGLGRGARFTIELPVGPRIEAPRGASRVTSAPMRNLSILVVDDEPEVAHLVAEIIGPEDNRIVIAPNGFDALAMLESDTFDVVVTDLRMPRLDGIALYRAIDERYPALRGRVVLMTGDTLRPSTADFLRESRAITVFKPFSAVDLEAAVHAAAAGRGTSPGPEGPARPTS